MFIIILTLLISFLYWYFRKPQGLPPGQWGFPILGALPFIGTRRLDEYVKDMAEKYGKVFCFRIGTRVVIGLGDYETVKNTYAMPEFLSRPHLVAISIFNAWKNVGIVDSEGEVWQNNRRFALKHSRDFGFGKSTYDFAIQEEASSLVKELQKSVNTPTEIGYEINVAMFNIVWKIVANKRYDMKDPKMQYFAKLIKKTFEAFDGPAAALDFFPFLTKILPESIKLNYFGYKALFKSSHDIKEFYESEIKEHIDNLDRANPKDLIDSYLIEQERSPDGELRFVDDHVANLASLMADFFVGGSHTTAQTILWFFIYMALNPEIQKKLQNQIDEVVPRDRLPSFEDKEKLPLVEAAVHELHRIISLAPVGLPHAASQDTELNGFKIPKGALVVANLGGIHHSTEFYEKPNEFHLEHFLDENGKFAMRKTGYIPLSIGRRVCIGEPLVRISAFIFEAALLQRFEILPAPGETLSTEPNPRVQITNDAPRFKILLKERYPM